MLDSKKVSRRRVCECFRKDGPIASSLRLADDEDRKLEESTFLLARFDKRSALEPVLEVSSSSPGVEEWEATEGYFQLVLSVNENSENLITQLKSLGSDEVVVCRINRSDCGGPEFNKENEYSYFLIDAQPEKVDELNNVIKNSGVFDQVIKATGPYNLIARAGAPGFDDLDRIANDRLSSMDGVLRIRQLRIIKSWMR